VTFHGLNPSGLNLSILFLMIERGESRGSLLRKVGLFFEDSHQEPAAGEQSFHPVTDAFPLPEIHFEWGVEIADSILFPGGITAIYNQLRLPGLNQVVVVEIGILRNIPMDQTRGVQNRIIREIVSEDADFVRDEFGSFRILIPDVSGNLLIKPMTVPIKAVEAWLVKFLEQSKAKEKKKDEAIPVAYLSEPCGCRGNKKDSSPESDGLEEPQGVIVPQVFPGNPEEEIGPLVKGAPPDEKGMATEKERNQSHQGKEGKNGPGTVEKACLEG